jgi:hypothetical protein
MVQAVSRVLFAEGLFYGKEFAHYREQSRAALYNLLQQAIEQGEVDPSLDIELAGLIMETWNNAITAFFLREAMGQDDIMAWARSPQTREKIDKMLYVMEYGLRKTESEFKPVLVN